MKIKSKYILQLLVLLIISVSCDDILEQDAVDSFNEQSVWEDVNLTKAYLGNCYDRIGGDENQLLGMREDLLSSATDECLCIHRPGNYVFVKGDRFSPDDLGHFNDWRFSWIEWEHLYGNIKNVNVMLANIDNVPAATPVEEELLARMKAEAYFIRAFDYTNLLRSYGGVVLVDEPFELGEDYSTAKRASLEETRDFVLADIDKAIAGLPDVGDSDYEQGRATRAAAAALKSRLLSFCASELVNGGYEAGNALVSFQGGSRAERLQQSRDAAKTIMDGTYGTYGLTGTTDDPPATLTEDDIMAYSDNYYNIFVQKGEWNNEVIWGVQYLSAQGNRVNPNKWNGPNGYHNWGNNNPTEPLVRSFEMADGSEFQWDTYNPGDEFIRTATAAELTADPEIDPYYGREPRFYASVLYHGAPWQNRDAGNFVQTGYFIDVAAGDTAAGVDTRQAKTEAWNGTKTGYYLKKFADINSEGQYYDNENAWIEFRYAEVLLDYAEACIELGGADLQNGIDALNLVRNRAGLPDRVTTDQSEARDFLRHERKIEFYAEGIRWYDIRRWMIADEVIKNVQAMKVYEFSDGSMRWQLDNASIVDDRSWNDRNYWMPISRTEMNKAPQLTNNPGY